MNTPHPHADILRAINLKRRIEGIQSSDLPEGRLFIYVADGRIVQWDVPECEPVAYRTPVQYSPDVGSWYEYYDDTREISDTKGLTPLYVQPQPPKGGKLTEHEARRILDAALDLEKTGRMVSLTEGQEKTDFMARNRSIESFLRDILNILTEPTAIDAEVARLRDALLDGARRAESLKRECGTDPESPTAIQNSRYMGLSYFLRSAAKTTGAA
jgi:hypothetical protein